MGDIEVIKEKIEEMSYNKAKIEQKTNDLEKLQTEVHVLQRVLLEEKQKLRALEDEKNTPLNVHPWRRIEGSDPAIFSMLLKVQELQKELVSKTEQVLEKDLLIQQKERLYIELRRVISHMPGVEEHEQWEKCRKDLNSKQDQYNQIKEHIRETRLKIRQFKDHRQDLLMQWEDIGARYRATMVRAASENNKL